MDQTGCFETRMKDQLRIQLHLACGPVCLVGHQDLDLLLRVETGAGGKRLGFALAFRGYGFASGEEDDGHANGRYPSD
jgi:hypothetical protein